MSAGPFGAAAGGERRKGAMTSTTIIPLDGNAPSEAIIPAAAGIAQSSGGRIVLLTVLDPHDAQAPNRGERFSLSTRKIDEQGRVFYGGAGGVVTSGPPLEGEESGAGDAGSRRGLSENTLAAARLYLEEIASPLRDAGVDVDLQVVEGDPVTQIFDAVEREGADIVAMATHRSSAIARAFAGSATDEVVRHSPVPVLSMHGEKESVAPTPVKPETVIVPLDGSELSESAVQPAWDLAERLDANIVFVRSASGPESMVWNYGMAGGVVPATEQEEELGQMLGDVDGYLQRFVDSSQAKGLRAEGRHGVGSASDLIISEAERHPAPLIVMTTHGSSGLKRALLGSVTDQVVRNAECPVLIVGRSNLDED